MLKYFVCCVGRKDSPLGGTRLSASPPPLPQALADGCHLTRDTLAAIRAAGFIVPNSDADRLRKGESEEEQIDCRDE